jgi:heat shock protein HtpX
MAPDKIPCPQCGYKNNPGALTCNLCQRVLAHEHDGGPAQTPPSHPSAGIISPRRDFFVEIAANRRRSVVLLTLVTALMVLVGAVIGTSVAPGGLPYGIAVAAVIAIVLALVSYFQGDAIVLAVSGAAPVTREAEPQLFNVVEEMAIAAGLPMPAVYLIDDTAPNAFATGRDPRHAAITVTRGLLEKLTREELQGVIGHEMSHVRNLDIRFSMLAAILVGSIVLFCDLYLRSFRVGGRSSRSRGALPFVILAVVLAIVAPIFATLLQMAISRKRELLADASSVQLTRNPLGLANALEKIAADPEPLEAANRATQHLYIVNPLKVFGMNASALMSTHPPTEARIKILRSMA